MDLFVLCLWWISWCALHSLLIDPGIIASIDRLLPWLHRYYRILYNGFALLTLVPLASVTRMTGGVVAFSWQGWGIPGRILLLAGAFFLFWHGAREYDLKYLLGIKQLQTGERHLLLTDSQTFSETGVLGMTRHPWYFGTLLLIWSALPEYSVPEFLAAVILSLYLVVGTLLEERKIVSRHGDAYRLYQQRVSMFFPWKWLKNKMRSMH